MPKDKENLKTMLEMDDDITEISIFVDYAKFMICSILNDAEHATDNATIVFNHKNVITMTNIAFDYINNVNKALSELKKKSENYIETLRSCDNAKE